MIRARCDGPLRAAIVFLALALGACSSVPPAVFEPTLDAPRPFTVTGKVSWQAPADRGRASVEWSDDAAGSRRLVLTGPFGAGAAVLEEDARGARLTRGDEVLEAADAEGLLRGVLAVPLPLREARYWLLGLPAPGEHRIAERDEAGRPRCLAQAGWEIEFVRWQSVDGRSLPARLDIAGADVELRFVATRLALPGPEATP